MSNVYGLALIAKCPEDSVKIESRAKEFEKRMIAEFKAKHNGRRPFANLKD